MADRIQVRREKAAKWAADNPVLASGEFGLEEDTGRGKYGDGIHPWNDRGYFGASAIAGVTSVNGRQGVVALTKADVALSAVDNVADADKPISSAAAAALALKVPADRTVNGHPLSANVVVTKGDLGLGNVDNTADPDKPISIAASAAIAGKEPANANIQAHVTQAGAPHVTSGQRAALDMANAPGAGNPVATMNDIKSGYASDENTTSTTSSTPVNKVTLPFTPPVAGDYVIEWYAETANSNAAKTTTVRVWDGLTVFGQAGVNMPAALEYGSINGKIRVSLGTAPKTFTLDYNASANTSYIRAARLFIRRAA